MYNFYILELKKNFGNLNFEEVIFIEKREENSS